MAMLTVNYIGLQRQVSEFYKCIIYFIILQTSTSPLFTIVSVEKHLGFVIASILYLYINNRIKMIMYLQITRTSTIAKD